jgi:hypothetical protein
MSAICTIENHSGGAACLIFQTGFALLDRLVAVSQVPDPNFPVFRSDNQVVLDTGQTVNLQMTTNSLMH